MTTLRDIVLRTQVQLSDKAINIMPTLRDTVLGTRVQLSDNAINIMPTLRDTVLGTQVQLSDNKSEIYLGMTKLGHLFHIKLTPLVFKPANQLWHCEFLHQ
jgi:hypothetical protein